MTTKTKQIRVSFTFVRAADGNLLSRAEAVIKGVPGNSAFSELPVDIAALKSTTTDFAAAIREALDGGKKAIAEKRRLRGAVIKMLRLLGHYVESVSNNDMTTLLSSGFEALVPTRAAPQPLSPASIRRIDYGSAGQLLVSLNSVRKAVSYELRYSALTPGEVPSSWTSQSIVKVRDAVPCNGLQPGKVYAFQVRALGGLGFTDWSDTVTKMCT